MKLSLRTKLTSCVFVAGAALAWCASSYAALNTSEDFLVKNQPVLVSSPNIVVFSTNSMVVGTNRINLGAIASYAAIEATIINTDIVPKNVTFQISTNGGATWQTPFKTGSSALLSVIGSTTGITITNVTVYGYSVKYGVTNSISGQTLLVDIPVTQLAVANKQYVDDALINYNPSDWALYPATAPVNVDDQSIQLNDAFSITTEDATLRTASVRAFGTQLLTFESSAITSGSNVISTIAVTETNVTISVTSSGITSRPVVFHKSSLTDSQWQLVSSITNVTENYPTPSGGKYNITFGRITGDNYFTVFLESTNTTRTVRVKVPFYLAAGGTVTGEFAIQDGGLAVGNGIDAGGLVSSSTGFSGSGASLTTLNASELTSGTIPAARFGSATIPATALTAGGSFPTARSYTATNFIYLTNAAAASSVLISNGAVMFYPPSSSSSSSTPLICGAYGTPFASYQRFQLGDPNGGFQGASGNAQQMYSYHELILQGGRATTPPSFTSGNSSAFNTRVINTAAAQVGLSVEGASSQSTNLIQVANSSARVLGGIHQSGGFFISSNALSSWPTAPQNAGAAYFGNSNGVVYILTSGSGTTWTATNKLGP